MIIDLPRFAAAEEPFWTELESMLKKLEEQPNSTLDLAQLRRFHYLHERTSSDLGKISTFASEPELHRRLESLVARAYGEIHEARHQGSGMRPLEWFLRTFPQTFRRHMRAFWLSVAITLAGAAFGGLAVGLDPDAKAVLLPFPHLLGDPAKRVEREEQAKSNRLENGHGSFSAFLMRNNIQVSIRALALGITWGVGTIIILFYNGVILGAVCVDYIRAGQTPFLVGWLLPHGSFEIPAIIIAGQAGLLLGRAMIGAGNRQSLGVRLRLAGPDLVTLIGGVALLLVWAGLVESFFSQYHQPVLPYWFKILFGTVELALLSLFLARGGRKAPP
jgi:uncharacterized membrane protein SpoIIM required for sporulation